MTRTFENAAKWRDNKRAFQMALADLQGAAATVGLDLKQAEDRFLQGWPYVLRAEVCPYGSWRVLASLDVGLGEQGAMLLKISPGEARMFTRFKARDRAFYLRRICGLIETALQSGAPKPSRLHRRVAARRPPSRAGAHAIPRATLS